MKDNKGITLVALIVTVIILLILAGISVSILTGDNGIIKQAQNAKKESKITEIKEKLAMKVIKSAKRNNNSNVNAGITEKEVKEELGDIDYQIWSVKSKKGDIIRIDFEENDSYIIYDGNMEENTEYENEKGTIYRKFEIYDKKNTPRK